MLKTTQDSARNQTAAMLCVHGLNDYLLLKASNESVQYIYDLNGLVALVKDGKIYIILMKDDLS